MRLKTGPGRKGGSGEGMSDPMSHGNQLKEGFTPSGTSIEHRRRQAVRGVLEAGWGLLTLIEAEPVTPQSRGVLRPLERALTELASAFDEEW